MSEKEQLHGPDVSRETSESEIGAQPSPGVVGGEGARERAEPSPQAEAEPGGLRPDEITPEQQMLLDIMGRSMDQDSASGQGEEKEAEDSAPHQAEEREEKKPDAPPPLEKNKPSSFYVYLAVLFGAAFLMLLLAYRTIGTSPGGSWWPKSRSWRKNGTGFKMPMTSSGSGTTGWTSKIAA